jgi:hypothetical protein
MVRQSRLFAAACAAFFLALLGNSQSFAITLTAQGGGAGAGCTGFTSTSSTPVSGSQSCSNLANPTFAAQGDVASSASAGHVGAAVNVLSFGSAAGTNMQGTAIYTDVFFFHSSNPSLTNTLISLNLNVDGIMNVGGPFATSEILLRADIALASVGELRANLDTTGPARCTSSFSGGAGCAGAFFAGPSPLTTQSILVGLDSPVLVQLRLDATVSAAAPGSTSDSFFLNSLDFPIGVALFNLDPGITVDAPDSFVTNNVFAPPGVAATTPVPAALPLFASGLGALGLLAWRKKKKAAATTV